jgi:2-methylcitrate dehydratase PrpD
MTKLTKNLGELVARLNFDDIPAAGIEIAKTGIADCFGVMVAGASDPAVDLVDRTLSVGEGRAPLFPSGALRRAEDAALVNGVAAHVLDYDDVALGGHPSAVLVPCVLAAAGKLGATGKDILAAYIAGYEVWAELMLREPVSLHQKGWHPTPVRGAVAAAAAAAKLNRLDAERSAVAIAIAASMAAGLVANFGSMTKSFQVGRAAQAGILAARLAKAGMTAAPDAIEHPSGYLVAFSPTGKQDLSRDLAPDREWQIVKRGLNIKRYPICYATHRTIDGILSLAATHGFAADDVAEVRISTGRTQMLMVRNHDPRTALAAKFSMEFAVGSALVAGAVGLAQLDDAFVNDPRVRAQFAKLKIDTRDETAEGSGLAPYDTLDIALKDGREFSTGKIAHARGSHSLPLTRPELSAKFADCLGGAVAPSERATIFARLMELETLPGVQAIMPPRQ